MSRIDTLAATIDERLGPRVQRLPALGGELTYEVSAEQLVGVCNELRDAEDLAFEQLVDLSGIDYLEFGRTEWKTVGSTSSGFSRAVDRERGGPLATLFLCFCYCWRKKTMRILLLL